MLSQYRAALLFSIVCLIINSIGYDTSTTSKFPTLTISTSAPTTLSTVTTPNTTTSIATSTCSGPPQAQYSPCGYAGYTGPTCCEEPYECILYLPIVPTPFLTCGIPEPSYTYTAPATPTPLPCAPEYAQCGGVGFTGPFCCEEGLSCFISNEYFHECYYSDGSQPTQTPGAPGSGPYYN